MRIRPNSPRANEEKLSGLGEGLKEVSGLKKVLDYTQHIGENWKLYSSSFVSNFTHLETISGSPKMNDATGKTFYPKKGCTH